MTPVRRLGALALAALAGAGASALLRPSPGADHGDEIRAVGARLDALTAQLVALRQERMACAAVPEGARVVAAAPALPSAEARRPGAAVPAPDAAAPAPSAAAPSPRRPDPAAEEALQRGRALVAQAFVRGAWTDADAQALRPILATAGQDGSEELLRRLLPALNEGQLRVETSGPPF